jgi:hypothetical protein
MKPAEVTNLDRAIPDPQFPTGELLLPYVPERLVDLKA